jgi:hypothetical protein
VIYQWDAFAEEYARLGAGLDKPKDDTERKAQDAALNQSFILKILTQHKLPNWLRPIPYQMPEHPWLKNSYVLIFEVVPPQTPEEAKLHVGQWELAMGTPDSLSQATASLKTILESKPNYLPALIAMARVQHVARNRAQFLVEMQAVEGNLSQANNLTFEDRVGLCAMLAWAGRLSAFNQQTRACVDAATETGLRHLTVEQLSDFLAVAAYLYDRTPAEQKSIDLAGSLWSPSFKSGSSNSQSK